LFYLAKAPDGVLFARKIILEMLNQSYTNYDLTVGQKQIKKIKKKDKYDYYEKEDFIMDLKPYFLYEVASQVNLAWSEITGRYGNYDDAFLDFSSEIARLIAMPKNQEDSKSHKNHLLNFFLLPVLLDQEKFPFTQSYEKLFRLLTYDENILNIHPSFYFEIAEDLFWSGDFDRAKEFYLHYLNQNQINRYLESMSFLRLGEIEFRSLNFVSAGSRYQEAQRSAVFANELNLNVYYPIKNFCFSLPYETQKKLHHQSRQVLSLIAKKSPILESNLKKQWETCLLYKDYRFLHSGDLQEKIKNLKKFRKKQTFWLQTFQDSDFLSLFSELDQHEWLLYYKKALNENSLRCHYLLKYANDFFSQSKNLERFWNEPVTENDFYGLLKCAYQSRNETLFLHFFGFHPKLENLFNPWLDLTKKFTGKVSAELLAEAFDALLDDAPSNPEEKFWYQEVTSMYDRELSERPLDEWKPVWEKIKSKEKFDSNHWTCSTAILVNLTNLEVLKQKKDKIKDFCLNMIEEKHEKMMLSASEEEDDLTLKKSQNQKKKGIWDHAGSL
jgi:hypothetical protein